MEERGKDMSEIGKKWAGRARFTEESLIWWSTTAVQPGYPKPKNTKNPNTNPQRIQGNDKEPKNM